MRVRSLVVLSFVGGASLGACAEGGHGPGQSASIVVAPLSLPGIGFACYDLRIANDLGQTVWSAGTSAPEGAAPSLCSDSYGNAEGGDITYIAPCDASEQNTTDGGAAVNTATLWVDGLYDAGGEDLGDYQNPCPWPDGCSLAFECKENADTLVQFDLTIMRAAHQGFFDVAVNFEDIFCSAKVDCSYAGGQPIELLHGKDGERHQSVVAAFACSAGEDDGADTHLYVDTLHVNCVDGAGNVTTVASIDPGAGEGNFFPEPLGPPDPANPDPLNDQAVVWQYAVNQGTSYEGEVLYWNVVMGLNLASENVPAGQVCYLDAIATASDGPLPTGAILPGSTYPVINFHVALNPAGDSTIACGENPLNGGPPNPAAIDTTVPGVTTTYTSPTTAECFDAGLTTYPGTSVPLGFDAPCGITVRVYNDVNLNGRFDTGEPLNTAPAYLDLQNLDDNTLGANGVVINAMPMTPGQPMHITQYAPGSPFLEGHHAVSLRTSGAAMSTFSCPGGGGLWLGPTFFEFDLVAGGSYVFDVPYACGLTTWYPTGYYGIKGRVFNDKNGNNVFDGGDTVTPDMTVTLVPDGAYAGTSQQPFYRYGIAFSDASGMVFFDQYASGRLAYYPGQPGLFNAGHTLLVHASGGAFGSPPPDCANGADAWFVPQGIVPPADPFSTTIVDIPYRCRGAGSPAGAVTVIEYHDINSNGTYDAGTDLIAGAGYTARVRDNVTGGTATLVSDANGAAVLSALDVGGTPTPLALSGQAAITSGVTELGAGSTPVACPSGYSYRWPDNANTPQTEGWRTTTIHITSAPQTVYMPTGCLPPAPVCGNSIVEAGEACDQPTASDACPYGQASCTVCNAKCQLVPGRLTGYCGDGVKQPSEACDTNAIGSTCVDNGFVWGTMACNSDCTVNVSGCSNTADPCAGKPKTYQGHVWIGDNYTSLVPPGIDLNCLESITGSTSTLLIVPPFTKYPSPVVLPRLRSAQIVQIQGWTGQSPVPALATIGSLEVRPAGPINVNFDSLITVVGSIGMGGATTANATVRVTAYGPATIRAAQGTNTNLVLNLPGATTFGGKPLELKGSGTLNAPAADGAAPSGLIVAGGGPITGLSRIAGAANLTCEAANDLYGLMTGSAGGTFVIGTNTCTSVSGDVLPSLRSVGGTLTISGSGGQLYLKALESLGKLSLDATKNAGLTGVGFPKLTQLTGSGASLVINGFQQLTSLYMPAITKAAGTMTVTNNPLLSTCAVSQIRSQFTYGPTATTISGNLPDCTY